MAAVMPTSDGCVIILRAGVSMPVALSVEAVMRKLIEAQNIQSNAATPSPPRPRF